MRKEKYITQSKDGRYLRIQIRKAGSYFTKQIVIADYPSPAMALKAAVAERDKALSLIAEDKMTNTMQVRNFSDVYNEMKQLYPKRVATIRKYDNVHRKYLHPLDSMNIAKITAVHIMQILNKMVSIASDDTISQAVNVLNLTFKTARVKHYININPMEEVTPPKSEYIVNHRNASVSADTIEQVIAVLEDTKRQSAAIKHTRHMIALAIRVLYETGMRPAECFALTKDDVDLENRTLHIRSELGSSYTEENVVRPTKTELSERTIPYGEKLVPVLEEAMRLSKDSPFVFADSAGQHYDMFKVQCIISYLCRTHHIDFSLYMLRHQFSTDLILSGQDYRTIQELMGHSNLAMTVGYARSTDDRKREVMEKRDSALTSSDTK